MALLRVTAFISQLLSANCWTGSSIEKFALTIVEPSPFVKVADSTFNVVPREPKIPIGSPLVMMVNGGLWKINGSIVFVNPPG